MTTYAYDALARPTQVWRPGDGGDPATIRWTYLTWGTPNQPRFQVDTWRKFGAAGQFPTVERSFYDGLGRVVQQQTALVDITGQAEAGRDLVCFTSFDSLGRPVAQSAAYDVLAYHYLPGVSPYQTPDLSQPQTRTAYDALGRVTAVTGPDNAQTTTAYRTGRSGWPTPTATSSSSRAMRSAG